jgi:hypothetical protein
MISRCPLTQSVPLQEGYARVFQEVMTADDGPIGRQVVCPRPWMLPEDDWLLDGYGDQASMPIGRHRAVPIRQFSRL